MAQIDIKLQSFADLTGFGKIEAAIGGLQSRLTSIGQALTTGLGVAAIQSFFGAIESTFKGSIEGAFTLATEIKKGSEAIGVSTDAYQVLGAVMRSVGGDADQLGKAVAKVNLSLYNARTVGSAASLAYQRLGLDAGALERLPMEQRFEAIGKAVAGSTDKTGAFAAASEILGARNLPLVLAALQKLATEGYGNLDAAMTKSGRIMSEDTVKSLHDAELAIERLKKSVTIGVGETIGAAFATGEAFLKNKAGVFKAALGALFFGPSGIADLGATVGLINGPSAVPKPPVTGDDAGARAIALAEAQKRAEENLTETAQHLQSVEADANQTAYQKRQQVLLILQQELLLRRELISATQDVIDNNGGEDTKAANDAKLFKLREDNIRLQDQINRLRGQSNPKDAAQASTDTWGKFQDDGGPGSAGKRDGIQGARDWVTSLGTQAKQVASAVQSSIGSVVNGIADGITGWIDGTKSFQQSLASIGQSVLKTMLQTVVQMGLQWLVNAALVKTGILELNTFQDAQRVQQVAKENAASVATLPGKTANAAAAGISSYGLALVFGALAVALIVGLAGGFADGGFTSPGDRNQVAGVVHAGEWVAPQWMVQDAGFGRVIQGLEGARQGSSGFDLGGFVSPSALLSRPAQRPKSAQDDDAADSGGAARVPAHHYYFNLEAFAAAQQEHSKDWFFDMFEEATRKNNRT